MLRKPNSIPAGDTIIADPVMEPFLLPVHKQVVTLYMKE